MAVHRQHLQAKVRGRCILQRSHDRNALIDLLLVHAQEGRVSFSREGQPVSDPAQLAACAAEHVDLMLLRLAQMKLLR